MRARGLAGLALVLAATFAGCLGDDDGATTTSTSTSTSTTQTGTSATTTSTTATTSAPANRAPSATLSASIEAGAAPLNVTFTLVGTDADGDALTWTFDADGDNSPETEGDALPAEYVHSYEVAGAYNATLAVGDGQALTVVNVTITVSAAAEAPASQDATGSWLLGAVVAGCFGDLVGFGFPAELDGVLYASFAVDPATWGKGYTASVTSSLPQDSPGFGFLDASRTVIMSGFLGDTATGNVPNDAAFGVFWTCLGATVEGTYHAGPPA
jgi:PKD repeat protein